jgi:RNA polymerase sigma factor (sigma-70 family)
LGLIVSCSLVNKSHFGLVFKLSQNGFCLSFIRDAILTASANTEEPVPRRQVRIMNLEQLVIKAQTERAGGAAFAEVCQRFTGLVKKYANQPHLKGIKEDAIAEGWLAVAAAVQSYDQTAGVRFAGYVESRVKYAVWNLFKRERRRWQQEMPLDRGSTGDEEKAALSWLETLAAACDVETEVEARLTTAAVCEVLATLPAKQQIAIVKTMLGEARLADVAAELGVSPQAVYSLRQRGLARLKKELRKNSIYLSI